MECRGTLKYNIRIIYQTFKVSVFLERKHSCLNLGFVSPCIIIYSNKSTNQMHQSLSFIAYRLTL